MPSITVIKNDTSIEFKHRIMSIFNYHSAAVRFSVFFPTIIPQGIQYQISQSNLLLLPIFLL